MLDRQRDVPEIVAIDTEYRDAVFLAFEAFRKYANHFRNSESQAALAPLLKWLRSTDKPLGPGERDVLADLLSGEFGRTAGRPKISSAEALRRREIIIRVFELEIEWESAGRKLPYRQKAIDIIEQRLRAASKGRADRATGYEISRWMHDLSKRNRESLRSLAAQNIRNKSDQINSYK